MAGIIPNNPDPAAILESAGIEYKIVGQNLKCLCPFHNENSPSFSIHQEKAIYKCFGCGVSGHLWKLVDELGLDPNDFTTGFTLDFTQDKDHRKGHLKKPENLKRILIHSIEYIWKKAEWPICLSELNPDNLDLFTFLEKRNLDPETLSRAGVAKAFNVNTDYEPYWESYHAHTYRLGCLTYDYTGVPMGWQGRSIYPDTKTKTLNPKGGGTEGSWFLNIPAIHLLQGQKPKVDGIIILEGLTDFLSVSQAAYNEGLNLAVLSGVNGSYAYLEITELGTAPIWIWTDPDQAGNNYRAIATQALADHDNQLHHIITNKDASDTLGTRGTKIATLLAQKGDY